MKTIEIDEALYHYIASHTQHIGESASDILRRMLNLNTDTISQTPESQSSSAVSMAKNSQLPERAELSEFSRVRVMRELLLSDDYAEQRKAVNRFLLILSTLYQLDPEAFRVATESLSGRTRVYFASNEKILLQNGTHTKPQPINGTPFWVITNTNTGRKRSMIEHIMHSMQFPVELTEKVCGTL
ncbi:MAG: Negative modulator of initiation of replication [Candidatus Erwinia impunctatus]|nr:Negative modulator of initiation of replication [Culicoides impunctatus]